MTTDSSSLRSFLRSRSRPAPAVLDPADMGTCFGLDMTLDQPPLESAPLATTVRPWWQRLPSRKPAAV
jgi:hypothetical protein